MVRRLGAGASGAVYAVTDSGGHPLALKLLSGLTDHHLHEFGILARLRHPGCVQVREVVTAPALGPALVEELVEGPSSLHCVGPDEALPFTRRVLETLVYLHARQVFHGDLKPENILCRSGDPAKPVLVDFGVAVWRRLGAGEVAGTPPYMAPELLEGAPRGVRTDLYALGATLVHLLTGAPPVSGRSLEALRRAHALPLPPVADRAPSLPPALAALVDRLLSRDPADRPASASEALWLLAGADGGALAPPPDDPLALVGAPELIGRADALVRIDAGLRAAAMGRGEALLITGPPGAGRSRVLDEAGVRGRLAGATVRLVSPASTLASLAVDGWTVALAPENTPRAVVERLALRASRHSVLLVAAGAPAEALPGAEPLPLSTLDAAQVRALLCSALGAVRDAEGLAEELLAESGGWPGGVMAGLQRLVQTGRLQPRRGTWHRVASPTPVMGTESATRQGNTAPPTPTERLELGRRWQSIERHAEARALLTPLADEPAVPPQIRQQALERLAWMAMMEGDGAGALALIDGARAQSVPPTSPLLNTRATVLWRLGRCEEALQDARDAAGRARDAEQRARATGTMSNVLRALGRLDEARLASEAALEPGALTPFERARALNNLAVICALQGDLRTAEETWEAALALRERDARPRATLLSNLGYVALLLGHLERASDALEASLAQARAQHLGNLEALTLGNLGEVRLAEGRLGEAERLLSRSLEMAAAQGDTALVIETERRLIELALARGDLDPANAEAVLSRARDAPAEAANVAIAVAAHHRQRGDITRAEAALAAVADRRGVLPLREGLRFDAAVAQNSIARGTAEAAADLRAAWRQAQDAGLALDAAVFRAALPVGEEYTAPLPAPDTWEPDA